MARVGDSVVDEKVYTLASSDKASKPPAESQEGIRVRSLVIASFWAVVICLGLPIWLWTTSVYRARLPLREMLAWADGKVRILQSSRPAKLKSSTGVQTNIPYSNCY